MAWIKSRSNLVLQGDELYISYLDNTRDGLFLDFSEETVLMHDIESPDNSYFEWRFS